MKNNKLIKQEQNIINNHLRRIGVQEGSTKRILDHPFFSQVDIFKLKNGTAVPEFFPKSLLAHCQISSLKSVKTFRGDQKLFLEF